MPSFRLAGQDRSNTEEPAGFRQRNLGMEKQSLYSAFSTR
jgi:hypothetical protein